MRAPSRTKCKSDAVKCSTTGLAGARCLPREPFMLGLSMTQKRPFPHRILTLHDWEAKHYVIAAVIILVVMGMFAYSWS